MSKCSTGWGGGGGMEQGQREGSMEQRQREHKAQEGGSHENCSYHHILTPFQGLEDQHGVAWICPSCPFLLPTIYHGQRTGGSWSPRSISRLGDKDIMNWGDGRFSPTAESHPEASCGKEGQLARKKGSVSTNMKTKSVILPRVKCDPFYQLLSSIWKRNTQPTPSCTAVPFLIVEKIAKTPVSSEIRLHQLVPCLVWRLQSHRGLPGRSASSTFPEGSWAHASLWSVKVSLGAWMISSQVSCLRGATRNTRIQRENPVRHTCSLAWATYLVFVKVLPECTCPQLLHYIMGFPSTFLSLAGALVLELVLELVIGSCAAFGNCDWLTSVVCISIVRSRWGREWEEVQFQTVFLFLIDPCGVNSYMLEKHFSKAADMTGFLISSFTNPSYVSLPMVGRGSELLWLCKDSPSA